MRVPVPPGPTEFPSGDAVAALAGDPTRLAAALAHEVANALTPIVARCGRDRTLGQPSLETLRLAHDNARRAMAACRAVLDLATPAADVFPVEHARCDLAEAWPGVVAAVGEASAGAALEVHAARGSIARVPPSVVQMVLTNLVLNALRAAGEGPATPRVAVILRAPTDASMWLDPSTTWAVQPREPEAGPWTSIEVADNGPGFPLGCEREAFRPGWSRSGHGLGLAVCAALAQRWGGGIGAARRSGLGPGGRGARVVVAWPTGEECP